ncbi:VOC family protein [Streptomyces radiopugnans]|uniref:VOC family protein n=1 Tax=Streptomyces radiopugnans TaxID=403935 RepID=UPI002187E43F|nr:VOC family protein [Streptomyces radiopugnans]
MADTHLDIGAVVIDSEDPERLAAFWSELLGRPVAARTGPYVWLERGDGPVLGFQRADTPKTGKNRVHLDITSPDPAAERRRIESLGGRWLPRYTEEGGFLVMADPEGNEFCVIPRGTIDLDDEGRAGYLGEHRAPPPPA